ncbi:MAG: hypothetical protein MUC88_00505 [Planctomycetes bacterium]|nr:hypothetical protein [Planctomycetota bacterium]
MTTNSRYRWIFEYWLPSIASTNSGGWVWPDNGKLYAVTELADEEDGVVALVGVDGTGRQAEVRFDRSDLGPCLLLPGEARQRIYAALERCCA